MAIQLPKTCCICGEKFTGFGNNPWPFHETRSRRACDNCNTYFVTGARINDIRDVKSLDFLIQLARLITPRNIDGVAEFLSIGAQLRKATPEATTRLSEMNDALAKSAEAMAQVSEMATALKKSNPTEQ